MNPIFLLLIKVVLASLCFAAQRYALHNFINEIGSKFSNFILFFTSFLMTILGLEKYIFFRSYENVIVLVLSLGAVALIYFIFIYEEGEDDHWWEEPLIILGLGLFYMLVVRIIGFSL